MAGEFAADCLADQSHSMNQNKKSVFIFINGNTTQKWHLADLSNRS